MNLLKRIGWYLGGFSIGLIILAIFLKKKNAEFCYGIDCRILKSIRSKNIGYTTSSSNIASSLQLDSISLNSILTKADVNISKSNTKLDSCKIYFIESYHKENPIQLTIENCDKKATIQDISFEEK